MPPIALHMVLARQIARDLGEETIVSQPGPYLLGCTTPDIRVITRGDRFDTHFFDLEGPDHQDSVAAFFATYGRLLDPGLLNEETRAWVAGYVSHLILDEQYITGVYRPFFSNYSRLGGQVRANVMDRLLQFHLEREYNSDPELQIEICSALSCTVENIQSGFIEPETLERWRVVSHDVAKRGMDWDRMRSMMTNHLKFGGVGEGDELRNFLDSLPDLLDETIAHITDAELNAFLERSTDAARSAVARYLACE